MTNYDPTQTPGGPGPFGRPGVDPYAAAPAAAPTARKGKKVKAAKDKAPKDSSAKPVTRRVIGRQTKLAALFAGVVALLALMVFSQPQGDKTYVVRTTKAVTALTEVSMSQFEAIAIDPAYVEDDAITAGSGKDALAAVEAELKKGARIQVNLGARQQVRVAYFSAEAQLVKPLAADERLVSIQANVASAVAGQIKAGDRVDVVGVLENGTTSVAGVVLSDIEVVAVTPAESAYTAAQSEQQSDGNRDKNAADLLPTKPIPGTYVLRIKLADVTRLTVVDTGARVYLVLRGTDASTAPVASADVLATICGANATTGAGTASGAAACAG